MVRLGTTPAPVAAEEAPAAKKTRKPRAPKNTGPEPIKDAEWDRLTLEPTDRRVYRMSSLGGDLAQLVAGALGTEQAPMPAWLQPYLDEGTAAEPVIIAMFNEEFGKQKATYPELAMLKDFGVIAGYSVEHQQVEVRLDVGTGAQVRGHTDDITRINPQSQGTPAYAVLEVKKLRPTLYNLWMANRKGLEIPFAGDDVLVKYGWQVSALHHATGLPVYFVVGQFNPETKEIDSIDALLVNENNVPFTLAQIKARVMKADALAKKGEIPDCDAADDTCPYVGTEFCKGKPEIEFTDLDDIDFGKLCGLHYAYGVDMSKTDEQKEAEKDRKNLKDQIDKYMAEKGYSRGEKFRVWDEAGNEFEFEWVITTVDAKSYTMSYPKVSVVGELAHDAPEDEG